MAAAASQMMAQRRQSASPCGEYLEHMLGAACKHLGLSQADQQCSAYTSSTAGSRRLWHEASLALLLLSEVIILIHFMDHHFCSSAGPTCWPREQSSVGRPAGPGDTQDGSSAAAALFFRLVSKLFAFSVLLLPLFAPEPEWIQVSFLPAWARFPCTQPLAFLWANLTEIPALNFLLCPCFLP